MKEKLNELIPVDIDSVSNVFSKYLEGKKRIVFSAPFGSGKTYFLKKFFESEEGKKKYNVFHIFPINYQVSSNKDVLEYIKYDIILHLLSLGEIREDDKDKIGAFLAFQSYLGSDTSSVIASILEILGSPKVVTGIIKIIKKFEDHKDKINEGHFDLIKKYCSNMENRTGSIYEFDAISQIISENVKKEGKESVLVLDDLDRIDPDHIFRLLNVFSAHFDIDGGSNKLGFDKVIFVCDIDNIRNIYCSKYGESADFNGYINKFYSGTIFTFNNNKSVRCAISSLAKKTLYSTGENNLLNLYGYWFEEVVCLFVDYNQISIRALYNMESLKLKEYNSLYSNSYHAGSKLDVDNSFIVPHIRFLRMLFGGDLEQLKKAFSRTGKIYISEQVKILWDENIPIAFFLTNTDVQTPDYREYKITEIGVALRYQIKSNFRDNRVSEIKYIDIINEIDRKLDADEYVTVLIEAINRLDEAGML